MDVTDLESQISYAKIVAVVCLFGTNLHGSKYPCKACGNVRMEAGSLVSTGTSFRANEDKPALGGDSL